MINTFRTNKIISLLIILVLLFYSINNIAIFFTSEKTDLEENNIDKITTISQINNQNNNNINLNSYLLNIKGNILYVGGGGVDNYSYIQDAVDNSSNGDTIYIYNGVYFENIIINNSINIIGEDKNNTIIDGNNLTDVVIIKSAYVNFSGITVKNGEDNGIHIESFYNKIENTIFKENDIGLHLYYSNNNSLINNQFSNNLNAIHVESSNNNLIENNSIISNDFKGIWIDSSENSILEFNNVTLNKEGIILDGSFKSIIINNMIADNYEKGIYLKGSDNCTIKQNILTNNNFSIFIDHYSSFCLVYNNTVNNNDLRGIFIKNSSNNTVSYNNLTGNQDGIAVHYSNNNIIKNNNASYNERGILIKQGYNNKLKYNIISYNSIGIHIFQQSYNNFIIGNSIKLNQNNSIFIEALLFPSDLNVIYHNNFYHNSTIFNVTDECSNIWNNNSDSSYGGNYWSDFDEPSESAWDNNTDSIVDSPYNISGGINQDNYPLLCSWFQTPPTTNFSWTPINPTTSDSIHFIDLSNDTIYGTLVLWNWEFGDGTTNLKEQNPIKKYDDNGTYQVNLTVWDDDDASTRISKNITVLNMPPIADFGWRPQIPNTNSIIIFEDNSSDSDGVLVNWSWDFGDGNISFDINPIHNYSDDGVYIVNLTVVDDDGAFDALTKNITILNVPPIANFSWDPLSPSTADLINFTDLSYDTDGVLVNWSWDFGDGNISFDINPFHNYSDDGVYIVNLTVVDDDGAFDTLTKNITILNVLPIANFSWDPLSPSTADLINFTDLSYDTDGVIVNWSWDFGDGNISFNQNPLYSYADNGTYTINLTIQDDDGEINFISKIIIITNIPPISNFTWNPTIPKTFQNVYFTDLSYDTDGIIVNWSWDFGDGNISYDQNPVHTYTEYNHYSVSLTIMDDDSEIHLISKNISILITSEYSLIYGWNIITIPVENNLTAKTLAENISGCEVVSHFDANNQTYKSYVVGVSPPHTDFNIEDGLGYFVVVNQNSIFTIHGFPIENVSVHLYVNLTGWNMIGWYHDYNTTASSLADNITNCSVVSMFDSILQTYHSFIVGVSPPSEDFIISLGEGVFIVADEESIWYGSG